MAVYKTKEKEVVDTKGFQKCGTCFKEAKPIYKLFTTHTFFCSKKCRDVHFNRFNFSENAFKIR